MKNNMKTINSRWMMLLAVFFVHCALGVSTMQAQPKKSRVQQQAKQQSSQSQSNGQGMTQRMRTQYPTALEMPEDVVWRRDIYREVNLEDEQNSGLYFPVEPMGKQLNLFTYLFKLALNGYIPVYEYRLDGNEVLDASAKVDMKTILDNYRIFYEEANGKLKVDNSDIPSAEVKMYYLKESAYYDQANSSFHIKPQALCPVMLREDDFGGESAKYPLFWVKYSDVEPYLSRQTVRVSEKNDASLMTLDDYFTLNKYKGKIYKTNNSLGKTLAQIAGNDSTKLTAEQKRIEAELEAFRNHLFGDKEQNDSLDADSINGKSSKTKATKERRQSRTKSVKSKNSTSSSSSGSSAPRVSVRRQRH